MMRSKAPKQVRGQQKIASPSSKPADVEGSAGLPLDLQQAILNTFATALPLAPDDLPAVVQEVKGHLFRRDFAVAFGKEEYLAAYAWRWSAARALVYAEIFSNLQEKFSLFKEDPTTSPDPPPARCGVLCIGGGAGAELVGLAALTGHTGIDLQAVDIADWSFVLERLQTAACHEPPANSGYANALQKAAHRSLLDRPDQLSLQFDRKDILTCKEEDLRLQLASVSMVTLMFTLNELFTTSISKTTALLLAITNTIQIGSWLLVVDSPGSYSEVKLSDSQKQYPMQWLLDHTLLQLAGEGVNSRWRKHMSVDSKWFRVSPQLQYQIDLENTRYQIHLYQRQDGENA